MEQAALITGGATRLGRHFALALAKRGYDIALHYNSSTTAAEKSGRKSLQQGGIARYSNVIFPPRPIPPN